MPVSFDLEALGWSDDERERPEYVKATCAICGRSMYKTEAWAGEATEWRHNSTGHAVSWSPQRHNAGLSRVQQHAHKWGPVSEGVKQCGHEGCDSEMSVYQRVEVAAEKSEKEEHVAASRRRGGEVRREQTRDKPGKTRRANDSVAGRARGRSGKT